MVLTILAVMAMSASVLTTGAIEQARYDSTAKLFESIRTAIVGIPTDYSTPPNGYVAENAGLPDDYQKFYELLRTRVHLGGGRGQLPILSPSLTEEQFKLEIAEVLKDAWGRSLVVDCPKYRDDKALVILSYGADGLLDANDPRIEIKPEDIRATAVKFLLKESNGEELTSTSWTLHWRRAASSGEFQPEPSDIITCKLLEDKTNMGTLEVYGSQGARKTGSHFITIYPRSSIFRELVLRPVMEPEPEPK